MTQLTARKFTGSLITSLVAMFAVHGLAPYSLADEVTHTTDVNELTDSGYWDIRFASMMFDIAMTQHQPDIAIHYALDNPIHTSASAMTQYPKDPELAAIHKKLQDADAKLDLTDLNKNAFTKACPWLTTSFGDTYEKFHVTEELLKAGRKDEAADQINDVKTALAYLDNPKVSNEWPDELKNMLADIRTKTAAMAKVLKP